MKTLLHDSRVQRLFVANTLGSIGSGITMFAVPWLLVHRLHGDRYYLWATIGTTLALLLFMPYYGAWVDRSSRKTMLLASEVFGFAATATMACTALLLGRVDTWQLVASYFFGMLYYTLHYPAKFAFIQQIFARSQYQSLMGLLEIQGQTAMMIAGGLGGILVHHGISFPLILLIDALTYAVSFWVQLSVPYTSTHLQNNPTGAGKSVWSSVAEGWKWLSQRPTLAIFLSCTFTPFIAVMAGNYLFPLYVTHTLQAGAHVFGWGEVAFALGAIAAGGLLPQLIAQHSAYRTIAFTMLVFIGGLVALVTLRVSAFYFVASALLGFGNAGCRVARGALILHLVPNEVMGRVTVFYNVFDRSMRTFLVFVLGVIGHQVAARHSPPLGFLFILLVVLIAFAGMLRTRSSIRVQVAAADDPQKPVGAADPVGGG